jgi:hypothetical protein
LGDAGVGGSGHFFAPYNARMNFPTDSGVAHAQLIEINRAAFAAGSFAAAYHAAMTALHAAEDVHDVARLRQILARLTEQAAGIDAAHPADRLSKHSAAGHGHPGVFHVAVQQAQSMIQRLTADERRGNGVRRTPTEPARSRQADMAKLPLVEGVPSVIGCGCLDVSTS